jgi:hypothetical protein
MKITKSELKEMIRGAIREELRPAKSLKESSGYAEKFPYAGIDHIIDKYNSKYAGQSLEPPLENYPEILGAFYAYDQGSCDIIIDLDAQVPKAMQYVILFRLFEDYTKKGDFDDLLSFSWLDDNDTSIAFWYGRLDNLDIDTGLEDEP